MRSARIACSGRPISRIRRLAGRTRSARLKDQFAKAGIPESDRRKIVYENAKRVFGLGE